MALTPKKLRFVQEYLIDGNALQAAIRAGYSAASAGQQGHRLSREPEVSAAIAECQLKAADKSELSIAWIVERLRWKAETGAPAESIKSLELLGKYLGMFKERLEHSGPNGTPISSEIQISFVRAKPDGQAN